MSDTHLYNGDCLIESDNIESGSVDLILTDLPYGNMKNAPSTWDKSKTEWDTTIEPKKVYEIANRMLRKNGKMVLFSQEPYTNKLITEATPNVPFSYRGVWQKDNFANALGVNKSWVSFIEDILVFSKVDCGEKNIVRDYLIKEKKQSKLTLTDLNEFLTGIRKSDLIAKRYFGTSQWEMPTKEMYLKLQKTGYFSKDYNELFDENKCNLSTFNLWEGNKYKSNILKYKKDYNGFHSTQKPVLLLEDLIKTFSNENDLVVDLTMGSGSTGVACVNTNRSFIGIEKDENYFNTATGRVKEVECKLF